jgi:FixJ family two-component response regulator
LPKTSLISIVDDDESVREALQALMRSLGLPAESFASASEFLASGQLAQTACLIADIQMPQMTGIELHHRLKAGGHAIPTILITAHPDDSLWVRGRPLDVMCCLSKPFDEAILLSWVETALAQTTPSENQATGAVENEAGAADAKTGNGGEPSGNQDKDKDKDKDG